MVDKDGRVWKVLLSKVEPLVSAMTSASVSTIDSAINRHDVSAPESWSLTIHLVTVFRLSSYSAAVVYISFPVAS